MGGDLLKLVRKGTVAVLFEELAPCVATSDPDGFDINHSN